MFKFIQSETPAAVPRGTRHISFFRDAGKYGGLKVVGKWLRCGFICSKGAFMQTISNERTTGFSLFDSVPRDYFHFGEGPAFQPKIVSDVLGLKKEDVSKLASVSQRSVRYDEAIPEQVRERLQEIAMTANMVAKFFDGDTDKTVLWFKARNPLLGDISPKEMIRLGRYERLRKFIVNAVLKQDRPQEQQPLSA